MAGSSDFNLDDETIRHLGLQLSDKPVNAAVAPDARVFEFPLLENVYIMESDLYGNVMPKDSCFLAFYGKNGLMGKHVKVETLKRASLDDIKKMVESNSGG